MVKRFGHAAKSLFVSVSVATALLAIANIEGFWQQRGRPSEIQQVRAPSA
ncbi:MAG: hypothetical protein HC902_11995 [Calothrix sp. SM1_5_4]|nr:hypothetical protein [Calothrix sp. SM1_5_4]